MEAQDQQDAKAVKAQKERERRAIVKALTKAELAVTVGQLDEDQRRRALESAEKHPGLKKKALADFILSGKTLNEQVNDAKAQNAAKKAEERTRQNITRSADPEAAELARASAALAPDVRSAFLPKDARAFLDEILSGREVKELLTRTVEVPPAEEGGEPTTQEVSITLKALEAFAVKGEKDKDVRAHLAALGHGTRLWGRKLGLMMVAQHRREMK